jgi:hypothetical protein
MNPLYTLEYTIKKHYATQTKGYEYVLRNAFLDARKKLLEHISNDPENRFSTYLKKELETSNNYFFLATKGTLLISSTYDLDKKKHTLITIQEIIQEHQLIASETHSYNFTPIAPFLKAISNKL